MTTRRIPFRRGTRWRFNCRIPVALAPSGGRYASTSRKFVRENDLVLLKQKGSDKAVPILSKPLCPNEKIKMERGAIATNNIIGKAVRDLVSTSKGIVYRIHEPTLGEYTDLSPRLVTPIYSQDTNLIVSLLDLHPSTPDADNGGGQDKIEIFEAGTGHGALTLNLARAIHGANIPPPPFLDIAPKVTNKDVNEARTEAMNTRTGAMNATDKMMDEGLKTIDVALGAINEPPKDIDKLLQGLDKGSKEKVKALVGCNDVFQPAIGGLEGMNKALVEMKAALDLTGRVNEVYEGIDKGFKEKTAPAVETNGILNSMEELLGLVNEGLNGTVEQLEELTGGVDMEDKTEAYDRWRANRRAVIHTLDQSAAYSAHAQKTVKNFRQGMYFPNVNFHVGSIEHYISGRMSTSDEPFLNHAILDLPNTHQYLDIVGKALKPNGSLVTWCPSITQINKCVTLVKEQTMPLLLERVIEVGQGLSGGREWDVRMVRPRALSKVKVEPKAPDSDAEAAEPAADREEEAPSTEQPIVQEDGWEMVCRPKVGVRVIGGGFIALWRKMERS